MSAEYQVYKCYIILTAAQNIAVEVAVDNVGYVLNSGYSGMPCYLCIGNRDPVRTSGNVAVTICCTYFATYGY